MWGDLGSIPGLRRSPGERKGYPLQYSGLENSLDCIVHGVTKSQTWVTVTITLAVLSKKEGNRRWRQRDISCKGFKGQDFFILAWNETERAFMNCDGKHYFQSHCGGLKRGPPPSRYVHPNPNLRNLYGCFILQHGKCFTNVIKDLDIGIILDCPVSSM